MRTDYLNSVLDLTKMLAILNILKELKEIRLRLKSQ